MIYRGIVEMTLRERLVPLALSVLLIAGAVYLFYVERDLICGLALCLRDAALWIAGAFAAAASCLAGVLVWFFTLLLSLGWLALRILAVIVTAGLLVCGVFLLWVYGIAPAIAGLRPATR